MDINNMPPWYQETGRARLSSRYSGTAWVYADRWSWMEQYLKERSMLFNASSTFSCPEGCERYGCKEPDLHISVSLVDLLAISWISGREVSDIYGEDCRIGFDPIEEDPWVGRLSLELKKPCHYLDGKICVVYAGRPIACALFPESRFLGGDLETGVRSDLFRKFPCLQKPCFISFQRRETIQRLLEMSVEEGFLSDFYLFGISPFLVDLKNIAAEGLGGIVLSEKEVAKIPHHRMETLLLQRLSEGGYLSHWETKIEALAQEGFDVLGRMKKWTDPMAAVMHRGSFSIAHQFDGNRLLPIHLLK